MKIFQNSVLNKYLNTQDEKKIDEMYCQFTSYFHHPERQEGIRNSKKEHFKEEFLRELFVNILGYTLNPKPNFNITTELKNEKGAKKTDGAILKNEKVVAVIELKGTDTKDLDKTNEQAFDYKNKHSNCLYVITSNCEKLRLFIHNAVAHIEFNLFTLRKEDFKILWLCLSAENIMNDVPVNVKKDSIIAEENVTKQLYKDYSTFKKELWQNICKNRADLDPLLLFKKTQKLLDRFLFMFFAEDSGLLPPNSIAQIIECHHQFVEDDTEKPLYEIFKQYFGYLNKGRKGKTAQDDIFAYSSGLFLPDKILDQIVIDDDILKSHIETMTAYDFKNDVDVNILGHIFENSLNEIENVTAQLQGEKLDKSKTKRKKDGVFYTPKYITKYIVENTVGKLCEEKKAALKIIDKEYAKGQKNRNKTIVQTLYDNLQTYRNWLLGITICDPACGSGAFLNQALEFLMHEHVYIDELQANLLETSVILQDVSSRILERNIYGVDINDESVEIAKLSLWLRTAQSGRKLTSLNGNIKCGNSLIDDLDVAGEKAFNWQKEFPQIFEKGGFDVIIGNPPYGAKLDKKTQNYLNKKHIKGGSETVISFLKVSHELLNKKGEFGFIIPKSFSFSSNYKHIREFLLNEIQLIVDCKKVWKEVKLEQVIVCFTKNDSAKTYKTLIRQKEVIKHIGNISKTDFKKFGFLLNGVSSDELHIANILINNSYALNEISYNQRGGSLQKLISQNVGDIKILGGANIQREGIKNYRGFVDKKAICSDSKNFINTNSILAQNIVSHVENPVEHIKIISCVPATSDYALLDTINQITITNDNISNKFINALLTSKVINWYCYRFIFGKAIRTMHFDNAVTDRIPVPKISDDDLTNIEKLQNQIDALISKISKIRQDFKLFLLAFYTNNTSSKKLDNWDNYKLEVIVKEINTLKKDLNNKLKSDEEFKLFETYNSSKKMIDKLKSKKGILIDKTNFTICKSFKLSDHSIELIYNQMP